MRWDQLFADLEAQWEAEARRDLDSEVADRTRRERATIGVYERLAVSVGAEVRLLLRSGRRSAAPWRMWGGTGCC